MVDNAKKNAIARVRRIEEKRQHVEKRLGPFACFLCCCCRSMGGITDMLTNGNTREFALAVILGEGFAVLVESISVCLFSPFFATLTSLMTNPEAVVVKVPGDFVVLQQGATEDLEYASAIKAIEDGATVLDFGTLGTSILTCGPRLEPGGHSPS